MRIRDNRNVESTFGDQPEFQTTNFTAEVGGKFFDIVLDKLYTNKPRSIIRELSTNCYDSHVAAGKADVPFYVQLPTSLDANITFRDYGVSLTHEQVMHLYTTVFASTKTEGENADDFVGAFGLGSKTPYAYTDSFVVTAWLNGEKRVYVATRGADGTPSLTHLTTEPSDEEQGFSVSFPVQEQDFYRFRSEAETVFEGFDVKPIVPGLELKIQSPLFSGENWTVTPGHSNAIRQGCVIYPLHDGLNIETSLRYGFRLTVTVPIGTADVAANREALSLDDVTIANVTEAFAVANKELEAQVTEFLLDAPDLFEANKRWNQLNVFFNLDPTTTFHGQILNGTIEFNRHHNNTPEHIYTHKEKEITGKVAYHVDSAGSLLFLVDRTGNDMPRKRTRIRSWVKSEYHAEGRVFILKNPTSAQLGALVRRLHLTADQIIGVASLPDVEIKRSPRSTADKGPVQGVYNLNAWPVVEIAEDYLYVEIERVNGDWATAAGKLFSAGYWSNGSNVRSALSAAALTIGEDRPVYAMTAGAIKRYKPKASQSFHTVVETWAKNNRRTIQRQLKIHTAVGNITQASNRLNNWNGIGEEGIDKILARLAPSCTSFGFDYGTAQLLNRLDPAAYTAAVEQGEAFAEKAKERYPLLFSPTGDDILRYIHSNPRKRKGA